ncbi:hypothetical protein ILUMI_21535 [Ignelater luminosus]|uniref:C2H2-type domain-containing protein n=1 Tax=Ignelater luminosus TaxID=2038154 RepID=A0A8K0CCA6_IGNLU|nr:hypothetical protein ILUMI_21535 [Ignelater luminosus]
MQVFNLFCYLLFLLIIGEETTKCEKCKKTFKHGRSLMHHMRYECGKAPTIQCQYCLYRTKRKTSLKYHVAAVHQKAFQYKCLKCNRQYVMKCSLQRHLQYECEGKKNQYQCNYCGKKVNLHCNLLKHMRSVHPERAIPDTIFHLTAWGTAGDLYIDRVIILQKSILKEILHRPVTDSAETLYNEAKVMTLPRLYYAGFHCAQCNKVYKLLGSLQRHIRYECNKEGQFTCPVCSKMFKHRHSLRSHQITHVPAHKRLKLNQR